MSQDKRVASRRTLLLRCCGFRINSQYDGVHQDMYLDVLDLRWLPGLPGAAPNHSELSPNHRVLLRHEVKPVIDVDLGLFMPPVTSMYFCGQKKSSVVPIAKRAITKFGRSRSIPRHSGTRYIQKIYLVLQYFVTYTKGN